MSEVIIVNKSVHKFGNKSFWCYCPECGHRIKTRTKYIPTRGAHLLAILLCLSMCLPFICLPYFLPSCQDVEHYCPSCNAYIGTFKSKHMKWNWREMKWVYTE
ncbi:unnamed protein product [Hermetia illucens]|uniref:LITAF domain-containing protein n=1 Tax=Hermetia illucens TaxID=343691 RepID=A0A7R8UBN9_HERIL|nr:lipopolysaccharide-induced tumor necrosis factor-alpha factor homolog [Hermetia illucens]CAD7077816.1 unnamed protein product [Hermetia illucens]